MRPLERVYRVPVYEGPPAPGTVTPKELARLAKIDPCPHDPPHPTWPEGNCTTCARWRVAHARGLTVEQVLAKFYGVPHKNEEETDEVL
jgi:hypothetical protein